MHALSGNPSRARADLRELALELVHRTFRSCSDHGKAADIAIPCGGAVRRPDRARDRGPGRRRRLRAHTVQPDLPNRPGAPGRADHRPGSVLHAPGWALLDTTCARLMTYPDKPPPAGYRAGPRWRPPSEGVAGLQDLHVHCFGGASASATERTSTRARLPAPSTARSRPAMNSPGVVHMRDIVGAADVLADGEHAHAASSRAETRSWSGSPDPPRTFPPARRCPSSVPSRRTCRSIPKAAEPSPAPAPITSPSTGRSNVS